MVTELNVIDQQCINTIRFLAVDAIQKANSGHPGMPMGAAPMAYVLWTKHLKHNPANPHWMDRDRFVLSAGHGSMLLYALLHLTGYDVSLDDIRNFRQWESKTPGHPEFGDTPGVELTTGPLGQGISHAVGMAIAEAHLSARYNCEDYTIVDHYTYVVAGDGDLMEGVAAEACSMAGHLNLGKLIVLYDDNRISLAGATDLTFTEDVRKRFEACGWHVQQVDDGNDIVTIDDALNRAKDEHEKPSLICVRTIIGYGAPTKQGTFGTHGSPLGFEEVAAAKLNLDWPTEPDFHIPDEALTHFRQVAARGVESEAQWGKMFTGYTAAYPELADELTRRMKTDLPDDWESDLPSFSPEDKGSATRKTSEAALQALAPKLPELMGGSADLNPSCYTWLKGYGDFQSPKLIPDDRQGAVGESWGFDGRNIHFGVREHAMGTIASGMALHGGFISYTGTFLTFSDYMRPPMRLAAMSGLRVIYVFTHDSIGVGEDGPTHQPIEQIMSLRTIPNLTVIRPCDANETVEAWRAAVQNIEGPTALIFSRQNLPVLDRNEHASAEKLHQGAYILWPRGDNRPDIIMIATGAEVHLALAAGKRLAEENIGVRVISMPSWELFDRQPADYRKSVLPSAVRTRMAIEAGMKVGWERYVGLEGVVIGMDRFGASAPANVLFEKFGFTVENVMAQARTMLKEIQ